MVTPLGFLQCGGPSGSKRTVLPGASSPLPRAATALTQDGEACGARPYGGLDGLALVHSVILELCPQDLQVMLPGQVVPYHQVLWVACGHSAHVRGAGPGGAFLPNRHHGGTRELGLGLEAGMAGDCSGP